eukprot:gnl/TRDRNA2_/TRDRNA2_73436_c0_seq1.p1 gnl/TRDRNA2_/TRDRNA2_73436_c0~~gnl/TRDRNA2_/TRDRNA2_73436_c0_seq1.p1  ORF type:complete len:377 (+),score=81.42 gnl/TRDRNA2_/TRDRNA2_73436_c0_seq1:123-1253(+)
MVVQASSPPMDLNGPLWVEFRDPQTGQPYFFNVLTHERSTEDPDPEGALSCETRKDTSPKDWQTRPARVQKEKDTAVHEYVEGQNEYNVWYGKFEGGDRRKRKEFEPACSRCNPLMDAGWTEADQPGAEDSYFCYFFAKGCCNLGFKCKYYHRVPEPEDCIEKDAVHDIFGRMRFANHRDDMNGVGCITSDNHALYIGDIRFDRKIPAMEAIHQVERLIEEHFGVWGEIVTMRVIPRNAIAFLRYKHRGQAEFAKVAMDGQKLGLSPMIDVRWARDDPNPKAIKQRKIEREKVVDDMLQVRAKSMGWSESDLAGLALGETAKGDAIAPYPALDSGQNDAVDEDREDTAAAGIERMNALLAKIDAMHSSGDLEAPAL